MGGSITLSGSCDISDDLISHAGPHCSTTPTPETSHLHAITSDNDMGRGEEVAGRSPPGGALELCHQ